jgi:hypothetical protein
MNMRDTKGRWRATAVAALGALGLAGTAWAGAGTASDSLTVTITPQASYIITVTTPTSGANLGAVPLGQSTWTVQATTVAVTSTYQWTGLSLTASVSHAGTAWSFVSSNTHVQDGMSAWALFTDTSVVTAPAPTLVSGAIVSGVVTSSNVVAAGTLQVGPTGGAACASGSYTAGTASMARFERWDGGAGFKNMECLPTEALDLYGAQPHMFLYFTLPPTSTDATAQNVTFLLLAQAVQ